MFQRLAVLICGEVQYLFIAVLKITAIGKFTIVFFLALMLLRVNTENSEQFEVIAALVKTKISV